MIGGVRTRIEVMYYHGVDDLFLILFLFLILILELRGLSHQRMGR